VKFAVVESVRKAKPNSTALIEATHVLQYLTPEERIAFVNQAYRALKVGGQLKVVVPHWSCSRAYGDLAVQWPPVVEQWFFHLAADWRKANNPNEKRYRCDFETTWGYGLHPAIAGRNQEYQQHAVMFFKEAAQDLFATLTKR